MTARVRDVSAILSRMFVGVRVARMESSWLGRRIVSKEGDDGVVVSAALFDQKNSLASEIATSR